MSPDRIRIATRKSQLALWQAEHVAALLQAAHPGLETELVPMSSKGDKVLDTALAKIGGKGLFIKELEAGLLEDEADIAVHSMKDVPVVTELPPELHVPVVCEREDPRDAFVCNHYDSLDALPQGATVGTASLRRQCQILARRPDLNIALLRGNVNSRLAKLDDGQYDAIILASAGLKRLGFDERIRACLEPEVLLPAVGQGAVGIECRRDDADINELIQAINHDDTHIRVMAERGMSYALEGGCQVPIAGFAELEGDRVRLRALVGRPDGSEVIRGERTGPAAEATDMGQALGNELLERGAGEILQQVYAEQ